MERVWYIWSNNKGAYSVAKDFSGEFIIKAAGPFTWDEAKAWMHNANVPGW